MARRSSRSSVGTGCAKTRRALFAARARLALADAGRRDRARVSLAETRASNVGMKNLEGFGNLPGLFLVAPIMIGAL